MKTKILISSLLFISVALLGQTPTNLPTPGRVSLVANSNNVINVPPNPTKPWNFNNVGLSNVVSIFDGSGVPYIKSGDVFNGVNATNLPPVGTATNARTAIVAGIDTVTNVANVFHVCPYTNLSSSITNSTHWFGPWLGSNYVQLAINAANYYNTVTAVGGAAVEIIGINYMTNTLCLTNYSVGVQSFNLYAPAYTYGALVCTTNPCIQMVDNDSGFHNTLTLKGLIISTTCNQTNYLLNLVGANKFDIEDNWFGYWNYMTNNQVNSTFVGLVSATTGPQVLTNNLVLYLTSSADECIFSRNSMLGLAAVYLGVDHLICEYNQGSYCGNNYDGNGYNSIVTDWSTSSYFGIGALFIMPSGANYTGEGHINFSHNFFYQCFAAYFTGIGNLMPFYSYDDEFETTAYECLSQAADEFVFINADVHQAFPGYPVWGLYSGSPYVITPQGAADYIKLHKTPTVFNVPVQMNTNLVVLGTNSAYASVATSYVGDGSAVSNIVAAHVSGTFPPITLGTNTANPTYTLGTNNLGTVVSTNFIGNGSGLTNLPPTSVPLLRQELQVPIVGYTNAQVLPGSILNVGYYLTNTAWLIWSIDMSPFAAVGYTNIYVDLRCLVTNASARLNLSATLSLLTNNPSGPGGVYSIVSNNFVFSAVNSTNVIPTPFRFRVPIGILTNIQAASLMITNNIATTNGWATTLAVTNGP
jgi:hypothetical protein